MYLKKVFTFNISSRKLASFLFWFKMLNKARSRVFLRKIMSNFLCKNLKSKIQLVNGNVEVLQFIEKSPPAIICFHTFSNCKIEQEQM